jgi:starch-binding outer membrane protein, SusD/RagB family
MKFRNLSLIIVIAGILFYACNKTYLNVPAYGNLSGSDLTNYKGVQTLLIATYSLLDGEGSLAQTATEFGASAASNHYYGSICGSEAHKGSFFYDQSDITSLEIFSTSPTNSYLAVKWQAVYEGIADANTVLRTMKLATDMTPEQIIEVRAETLFLRAFYHFEAKKMWNKIPFIDETVTFEAGNYHVVNDTSWSHIENDLDSAIKYLPKTQDQIGRVNYYAAEAYLAKVYLFEHKYQLARPLLQDLISNGVTSSGKTYALVSNYGDNFNPDPTKKNNSESVFAVQSSVNDGSGGFNGNPGDVYDFPAGGTSPGGCCGFFQPSQYFVNHFKTDPVTGLPDLDNFNLVDVTNDDSIPSADPFTPYTGTLDPRLDWSVGRRGIPYLDWGIETGQNWVPRDPADFGPYVAKKNVYYQSQQGVLTDNANWFGTMTTTNNVNLIRFADVLLWAAEIEVLTPGGDLEKARDYVNQVRARAMNPNGWVHTYIDPNNPTAGFTNTPAANYKIGLYTVPWTDPAFALKALQYERMLELGLEGHRFFDLVRWGIAKESIDSYWQTESIKRTYLKQGNFVKNKNEYFPIPQSQIDLSESANGVAAMTQNPGY